MRALARTDLRLGMAMAVSIVAVACGGGSAPPAPPSPPSAPAPPPGATQVTGRERLAWNHDGDTAQHTFRAYVDDVAVALDAVRCAAAGADSECSASLPSMSDGVHRVVVTAVSNATGAESERSAAITLQKVSTRAASLATALPDAIVDGSSTDRPGALDIGAGLSADVIARDVPMPAQLVPLPDGRVLVADGDGSVRVVYPGEPDRMAVALQPDLLDPPPAGALAIAVDADVATTHLAFVAYAYRDGGGRLRARIVRLREVGDRLGEPATIFDGALAPARSAGETAVRAVADGMRMAFGPDGLLYASLPDGLGFDGQPAASLPVPAVLRLTADGRTPSAGALTGVTARPLAFGWHPSTEDLLGLVADGPFEARVRTLGAARTGQGATDGKARFRAVRDDLGLTLRFETLTAEGVRDLAPLVVDAVRALPAGVVRLAVPAELTGLVPGLRGRLGDLVSRDGTLYAAVFDDAPGQSPGESRGTIVRVRP